DCPLPEGRGYLKGIPGVAGRQAGISLKGEVSNHKGNFDEAPLYSFWRRCPGFFEGGAGQKNPALLQKSLAPGQNKNNASL
ncbi:MAG: hypothetical protein LBH65_02530, partial [Desulfovibrio sp.]|nr:hypothetical protein [Desulfovibrio sp.]